MMHTVVRPGQALADTLLIMKLLAPFQRHFCRVTPIPPYGIALWCNDLCVVLDMPRGQYLDTVRRLYRRGYMFVAPAGMTRTLQEMDVASLETPQRAENRLDITLARNMIRTELSKIIRS